MLSPIIARKRQDVALSKQLLPVTQLLQQIDRSSPTPRRDFGAALRKHNRIAIIAEYKRASPSKGLICPGAQPDEVAKTYELYGASAMSVLTEQHFFHGDPSHLLRARHTITLPVLRKDFIVDEYQLYESRLLGADAVLLIAAVLEPEQMRHYLHIARNLGIQALVEVHDRAELEQVLETDAEIIGINNRNLHNFQVSLSTTKQLAPLIPSTRTIVSESGIHTPEDIHCLREYGIHAVLIGEALMTSSDPGPTLAELAGVTDGTD